MVTLHPTPNHLESLPIKMFEYMAAGLPVIASDFPVWRDIVDRFQCGLLVDPLGALHSFLRHPSGTRGHNARHHEEATTQDAFGGEASAEREIGEIEVVRASGIDHEAMPALVSSCDAVACTSETEGWPNSVKEALACGIPFVATDVGDLAAIAQTEPSCRIAAADPEAFAKGLCEVLTSPLMRVLRRHVESMDLPESSQQLKSLYDELLKS